MSGSGGMSTGTKVIIGFLAVIGAFTLFSSIFWSLKDLPSLDIGSDTGGGADRLSRGAVLVAIFSPIGRCKTTRRSGWYN